MLASAGEEQLRVTMDGGIVGEKERVASRRSSDCPPKSSTMSAHEASYRSIP
jgi:hypothetical protein